MNLLLVDCGANFLDFALRCKAAGHQIKWFVAPDKNGERIPVGDGLIEKVTDWTKWMRWSDLTVLSDNTRYIQMLEPYRKFGYPIFGSNLAAQAMELDRSVGQKVWKDAGVPIMDYKTFTSYDDAIKFVEKNADKRYVSKPSGDAEKALSFISKDAAGMRDMLRRWKKLGKLKQPFILQEFKPGIEMAIGGWFGKGGWNSALNVNFEFKKLLVGDLGCNTGEQGTCIYYTNKDKLADKVLFPVSDYLMKIGYTGYIDAAVIIDESGQPWPLEWTARPGWPHNQIISDLHDGDPAEWMRDLLDGYDSLQVKPGVATGVVVTHGDFPYNKMPRDALSNIPVHCDMAKPCYHPCEIKAGIASVMTNGKLVDQPTWVSAGSYLMVVTGVADTISGSARQAYKNIESMSIPNSPGYRTDIGLRLKKELPELQALGYCKTLTY